MVSSSSSVSVAKSGSGLRLNASVEAIRSVHGTATRVDVKLTDTTGKDRAVTLLYTMPVTGDGWQWLAGPRREVAGRWPGNCFACSNPSGLNLRFFHAEDGVVTDYVVPDNFCGFDGMVHGGFISMILDETCCWALFARYGRLGVTRQLTVRFLLPVPTGEPLQVEGRVQHSVMTPSCLPHPSSTTRSGRPEIVTAERGGCRY